MALRPFSASLNWSVTPLWYVSSGMHNWQSELRPNYTQPNSSRRYVLVLLPSGTWSPRLVERMGYKNPNYPIHRRSSLRLLCNLHVVSILAVLIIVTSHQTISPGCRIMEPVQVKNSQPFSVVHSSHPISSSSLDSTQPHINVKAEFAQTEPLVPVKSPSIPNSPTEHSPRMEVTMMYQLPKQPAPSQTVKEPQHQGVDGSRFTDNGMHVGFWTLRWPDLRTDVYLHMHALGNCFWFCWFLLVLSSSSSSLLCRYCWWGNGRGGCILIVLYLFSLFLLIS